MRIQITQDRNTGGQWFTFHLESERPRGGLTKATLRLIDKQWFIKCGSLDNGQYVYVNVYDFWAGVEHIEQHYHPATILAKSHLYNRVCKLWGEKKGVITVCS